MDTLQAHFEVAIATHLFGLTETELLTVRNGTRIAIRQAAEECIRLMQRETASERAA